MRNLLRLFLAGTIAAGLSLSLIAQTKPVKAKGECKDGRFTTAESKSGACSGHGGVKTWFAESAAKSDAKAAAKETKAPGSETKAAAKSVGAAAKDAGKSTGEVTKDVAKTTAKGTEQSA